MVLAVKGNIPDLEGKLKHLYLGKSGNVKSSVSTEVEVSTKVKGSVSGIDIDELNANLGSMFGKVVSSEGIEGEPVKSELATSRLEDVEPVKSETAKSEPVKSEPVKSVIDEPSNPSITDPVSLPAKEFSTTSKGSQVVNKSVPKDLKDYVKLHPNCDISEVLKYYSKAEVERQLKLGRVYKRKNKLLV